MSGFFLFLYLTRVYITPPVKLIVCPSRKKVVGVTPPKVYIPIQVVTADLRTETQLVVRAEFIVVHRNILYVNIQPLNTTDRNANKKDGVDQ